MLTFPPSIRILAALCMLALVSCKTESESAFEKGSVEHIKAVTEAVDDVALANAKDGSKSWKKMG